MRVLCWLLLLTALALPADRTAWLQAYGSSAQDAFEWGNYVSCARLLGELRKLYEPLAATSAVAREELASVDADRVLLLGRAHFDTDALALGEKVLASPDASALARSRAALGMLLVARDSQRPELVDRLLATETNNPVQRFTLRTFALERQLQKEPKLADQAIQAALEGAWESLQGFKPQRMAGDLQTDGLLFTEAERFWWRLLMERADVSPTAAAREQWKQLFLRELERTQGLVLAADEAGRPDYTLGFLDLFLDQADFYEQAGDLPVAERTLGGGQAEFLTFLQGQVRQAEAAHRKTIAANKKRSQGSGLDPKPLDYSRQDGALGRLQARALQLRARLTQDPGPLLKAARALQARVAQGTFLGMQDVRWDMLSRGTGDSGPLIRELLAESEKQAYRPGLIVALSYQGRDQARAGRRDEALKSLRQAVAYVDEYLKQSGDLEEKARYQVIYDLLAELELESGQTEQAYATLGQSQRTLAELPREPAVETLRGRTRALEQEVAAKRAAGANSQSAEELLAQTRGEYARVIARLRAESPRYEERLAVRPVNYARQQSLIPANAALVQYFPADQKLYIFVATRESLKIRQVAVAEQALNDELKAFRRAVLAQAPANPSATRLYEWLIQPVEQDVADKQVLTIVPTGPLCYLPFAALQDAQGQYLVSRKQLVTFLKSSDLNALGQTPGSRRDSILVLGDPDGSLPAASAEATEVARLFGGAPLLGAAATSTRLKSNPDVAYLHLATHGTLNARDPSASSLLLAEGSLTVNEVFQLQLDKVRLATLSACQTALGDANPGADLTTLAEAFSMAGATSVLASLWSVSDESTRDLMVLFYTGLKKGDNLAQALQAAQLAQLKAGRKPFQWAPFVLIGDWR